MIKKAQEDSRGRGMENIRSDRQGAKGVTSKGHGRRPSLEKLRFGIQFLAAMGLNGYIPGFVRGGIFTGKSKMLCVPVLNCYSCPGALGACPIGAMQAVAASRKGKFSFYVVGMVMLFGTIFGRLLCGFLCPFGWLQDLLEKIPLKKWHMPPRTDRVFRWVKYLLLFFLVLLFPAILVNEFGIGEPLFCKYICPAGTLEGGIWLMLRNRQLRSLAGGLFLWKGIVLLAVLVAACRITRFFCRYLCPLGAFYSLFNRFSCYQMSLEKSHCTGCGRCEKVCPMNVAVTKGINGVECIRCGRCIDACQEGAIMGGFVRKENRGADSM